MNNLNIGEDAVVMGNVSDTNIGNGAVVIGPDNQGNINLTTPMAVGRNAYAGPGSIAIGANAGAGSVVENSKSKGNFYGLQINDSSLGLHL